MALQTVGICLERAKVNAIGLHQPPITEQGQPTGHHRLRALPIDVGEIRHRFGGQCAGTLEDRDRKRVFGELFDRA